MSRKQEEILVSVWGQRSTHFQSTSLKDLRELNKLVSKEKSRENWKK